MKYYILSGMDKSNGYNFYGDIAEILRNDLAKFDKVIYIPTYPENREKCFELSKSKIFEYIGINFKKSIVLDYSYSIEDAKKIINENKLIFLYGGDPYKQMNFIRKYQIKDLIKNKTIIGLSAGGINMCKKAICTKDEYFKESNIYNGMGLVDFSIEPHFDIRNIEIIDDLKKFSKITNIYALEDDAYIILDNKEINYYRKYIFYKRWKDKKNRKRVTYLVTLLKMYFLQLHIQVF